MNAIRLREAVTDAPVKRDGRWKVIVAKPGMGSSATYSEEVLKRDAAVIVPEGAQSFINHGVDRDPTKMIGTFSEGVWSEEDKAVVSTLKPFSHWEAFVDEVGPHCGMSLYAMGEADEDGNLVKFIEDPYNGADLVARPGLVGSGLAEKLYESAVNHDSAKPVVENASAQDSLTGKDNKMEIKELAEKIDSLADAVTALVTAQEAKVEKAEKVAEVEEAVTEARAKYAADVALVESAREDLLPSQVKSLLAEAEKGGDIAPMVEAAKSLVSEMRQDEDRIQESAGRVVGAAKYESAAELGKVLG